VKPTFVETKNYLRFMEAMTALQARGSQECRLVVVDGLPGLGKTTILHRWAAFENCVYLRAKTEWSPYWMMSELLEVMRAQVPRGHEARFRACLGALAERDSHAQTARQQFAVVIDEADHVSSKSALVDTIRDFADLTGVPFVLVGMGRIRDNLTKYPQTASRISRYVRFEPAELDDVQRFLAAKCEVPVAPDLAAFVTQATRGFNREILEAIVAIEAFGRRNMPKDATGLTLREMAGLHLINDRKSGQPLHVPGR
jgi:DNA transposition AAA+ family ATPase